jgi:predicted ArsR family transcriptional regulator
MQGTRERILELIIEQREARVETLADELGITGAAVRRHLDHLRADGLVDVKQVKQATGRPFHAYHATEAATGVMPAAYADLLTRMLRGLSGEGVQSEVMASVAESMASRHRGGMPADGGDPAVLVGTVTDALRGEGILDAWRSEADGFHLTNTACPYRKAAEISELPCESDRKAIELLLGLDVQQVHRIVDGATCCEYLVHPSSGPQLIQIA